MAAIFKFFNSILGILAVIACLAAVGVIIYSVVQPDLSGVFGSSGDPEDTYVTPPPFPESPRPTTPGSSESESPPAEHVHSYHAEVYQEATCEADGRMLYSCECGEFYYEEIEAIGHIPGDWQVLLIPTATESGVRIRVCTVCAETIAREVLPATGPSPTPDTSPSASPSESPTPTPPPHVHSYVGVITTAPTCSVAGIRTFTCSCGSFYRENIRAIGHVPAAWEIVRVPTATTTGIRQRICNVCLQLIDSRTIPRDPDAPEPDPSALPSPHIRYEDHEFLPKEGRTTLAATCVTEGIKTSTCACGEEESETIPATGVHTWGADNRCTVCGENRPASASPSPS